ncbi:MAG TPA: AAA family ATPase [Chlamydiales bacterium]|nr:AAA family ATPase [Chlamydiales bacterium]
MFESILGNPAIKAFLHKSVIENHLPAAFLFTGIEGIGKSLFAKDLALHLLQSDQQRINREIHPDFHVIRPCGKSGLHSIETVRQLIDDAHAAPFEAMAKVFVIHDAHRMQSAAANALLKILEEPSPDTLFILITSAMQEILPTIASRCRILRFQALAVSEIATLLVERGLPGQFATLAQGSAGLALDLAAKIKLYESLFQLLAERYSYTDLSLTLEKIAKEIEQEDPVKQASNVESLFSIILMWHRDQIARRLHVPLFFPEAPQASCPLVPLNEVERLIDEARLAISRNMRLSVCLEQVLYNK